MNRDRAEELRWYAANLVRMVGTPQANDGAAINECLDEIERLTAASESYRGLAIQLENQVAAERRDLERLRKALESGVAEAEKVLSVHKEAAADNGRKGDQRKSDMAFGACCAAQSILDELRALSKDALR